MDERIGELERLYFQIGPKLLGYLRRRTGDVGDAEEMLHEVFVVAARNFGDTKAASNKDAWLFGIARNLLRSHARKARMAVIGDMDLSDSKTQPGNAADPRRDALRQAINDLPEGHREVVQLRVIEDMSYAQIAAALELPIGTVRSRLHHAILNLKRWAATWHEGSGTCENRNADIEREAIK